MKEQCFLWTSSPGKLDYPTVQERGHRESETQHVTWFLGVYGFCGLDTTLHAAVDPWGRGFVKIMGGVGWGIIVLNTPLVGLHKSVFVVVMSEFNKQRCFTDVPQMNIVLSVLMIGIII